MLGFEPRLAVLETVVLTVNTTPMHWCLELASNQLEPSYEDGEIAKTSLQADMVGPVRLELTTSRLSVVRSNQLSYEPVEWLGIMDSNHG